MNDWLYEATQAQAQLDDALTRLNLVEKENIKMRQALKQIAEDKIEMHPSKIEAQRNWFVKIARRILDIKIDDGI